MKILQKKQQNCSLTLNVVSQNVTGSNLAIDIDGSQNNRLKQPNDMIVE